ncbi:MAG: glycosyltransferase family 2 protein [Planctomycetota bacterium]
MTAKVTIGLPVFNGENFVAQSIESILAQTYRDFELLISDNASEDRTGEICRHYAALDSRITYERMEHNLGAAPNYNRLVAKAQGQYFKWAAHDDRCEPTFLERCVEVLDARPEVVLVHSKVRIIDDESKPVRSYDNPLTLYEADQPHVRFGELMRGVHACFEVFGLIRTEALRKSARIGSYISSDRTLIAELGLMGKLHEIPEELFLSRDHPSRSVRSMKVHARASWFDSSHRGRIVLPFWRLNYEAFKAIRRAPISRGSRIRSYGVLFKTMCKRWRHLRGDLFKAVKAMATGRSS